MGAKPLLRALTAVVLAVFIPAPGIAGGKAITAPYAGDFANFGCSAMTLGKCDGSAAADKDTGALAFGLSAKSSAGGTIPDDASGFAYTLVSTSHLVRKAVDVVHLVVDVHVNDALATAYGILFSRGFGGYGYSLVSAEVTMNTCNCGGGTGIRLVDARYGPSSVSNTDMEKNWSAPRPTPAESSFPPPSSSTVSR